MTLKKNMVRKKILKRNNNKWTVIEYKVLDPLLALCRELGAKCVVCLYHAKFALFLNQMNESHKIVVKNLQTIFLYIDKSERKLNT